MILRLCLDTIWLDAGQPREAVARDSRPQMFDSIQGRRRGFQVGLGVSLAAHAVLLALVCVLTPAMFLTQDAGYYVMRVYQPVPALRPAMRRAAGQSVFSTRPHAPVFSRVGRAPRAPTPSHAALLPAMPQLVLTGARLARPPAAELTVSAPVTQTLPDGWVRIIHPADAVSDVEVVQSGASETAAFLTGRPVRTFYLKLGASGEWRIEYCMPQEAPAIEIVNSMLIRLPRPVLVRAPYPRITVVPGWLPRTGPVVIYGRLEVSGKLTHLRLLTGEAVAQGLLERLEEWLFRPASQDGDPVAVEMVLALPQGYGEPPADLGLRSADVGN